MKATLTLLERKYIRQALSNSSEADCVVLIGSIARGTRISDAGDVDILVLNGSDSKTVMPGVQTTVLSTESLKERVRSGDDFTQWALRYGISIRGRSKWEVIKAQLLHQAPWPNATLKNDHAARRLRWAAELIEMGDLAAGREELIYAASHLARGTLLAHNVFPLSRPELPGQLRVLGSHELAELLEGLSHEGETRPRHLSSDLAQLRTFLTSS